MEVLVGTDLSVAGHIELADAAAALARLQSLVDHAEVQVSRRGRESADAGDASSHRVLIDEGRCTGSDAKATNGCDRVCETLPGFGEPLATGDVTGAHLDSLAQHTKGLTDEERSDVAAIADELIDEAGTQPPALFDRIVRVGSTRSNRRPTKPAANARPPNARAGPRVRRNSAQTNARAAR